MKLTVASHTHGNNLKVIEFRAQNLNTPSYIPLHRLDSRQDAFIHHATFLLYTTNNQN